MAVSRAPRSPQKAMAVLLGLALVFSLLLIAVSRESDLHVVHDRTGGHFEHDHHRVFDSHGGVSSLRGGAFGGERARAHPLDLARGAGAHGAFSSHRPHGATVGGSESSAFGEARAGGFGGAGGAVGGDVSSVRSRSGFEAARGGDGGGDADDRFLGGGSTHRDARVSDGDPEATPVRHFSLGLDELAADPARDRDRDPSDQFVVVPAKTDPEEHDETSSGGSFLHEVWDETKHLTREVEKFAGLVSTDAAASSSTATSAKDGVTPLARPRSTYDASGADPSNDDIDFENELALRPREVDDEAEDEEIEASDEKQQALFDAEALATAAPKKKGWW